MAITQLTSRQIGSVQRNDMDITTTGQAVVTKLIAGTNVSFSSTGVDAGTGDVTINASGSGSNWTVTGSDIYRNSLVRIGSASAPVYALDVTGQGRIATGGANFTTPYTLSVQGGGGDTWIEILNGTGGAGQGAFFGMTTNNFQMWNYQAGPIQFFTTTVAGTGGSSKLSIAAAGQITFPLYTGSTFDASPTKSLGVDGSGNVVTFTGGSGGITRSVSSISSNTTAAAVALTDYVYLASTSFTFTLPTAVGNTNRYTLKNTGTGEITLATTSSQTIDGDAAASQPTIKPNQSVDFISNNTNWFII